ncbi:MAG: hypothetical protein JNM09_17550 [Blastocatellia bacterium]|nr:hypothetical protein [Blastocatellia bacterium]
MDLVLMHPTCAGLKLTLQQSQMMGVSVRWMWAKVNGGNQAVVALEKTVYKTSHYGDLLTAKAFHI